MASGVATEGTKTYILDSVQITDSDTSITVKTGSKNIITHPGNIVHTIYPIN